MITQEKRTILIVDDHALVRDALALMINSQPDMAACGQAESLESALQTLYEHKADLVVLDVKLSGINGIEVLKNIKTHFPEIPVLVFSLYDEILYASRALRAGAAGYLMKNESPETFLRAIRDVLRGEIYLSAAMEHRISMQCFMRGESARAPLETLSDRELEVLLLLGSGNGTRAIAQKLNLSKKTIETHRAKLKEKLNLKNTMELVSYAIEFESAERVGGRAQACS